MVGALAVVVGVAVPPASAAAVVEPYAVEAGATGLAAVVAVALATAWAALAAWFAAVAWRALSAAWARSWVAA